MDQQPITAVGIDVSKGQSTVAVRRPGGEVLVAPFVVKHSANSLSELVKLLKEVGGNIRVVMEHTGMYWRPIALTLKEAGFFISVVNAMLIHNFGGNTIRKVKTDKADALKIANYALTYWADLREYTSEDETRQLLKSQSRVYNRCMKSASALRNCLIAQLDQVFPGANVLFDSYPRVSNGHFKWVDFAARFWHRDCVSKLSVNAFREQYKSWCKKTGYRFSENDALNIHASARACVATLPKAESVKLLITQSIASLNAMYDTLFALRNEMNRLASLLPEYPVVMSMHGAGSITGSQLIAEIGDVSRFTHKGALVAFAGVDAPPYQSGVFEASSQRVSKRGSPHLRCTLFQVCSIILRTAPLNDPVFQFMSRKRAEGKHFYVYMVAGANKFLRIYYARVKECMGKVANIETQSA